MQADPMCKHGFLHYLENEVVVASIYHRSDAIISLLNEAYPVVECSLQYETSYELLFAAILAAQCTDARVNIVMAELKMTFPTLSDYAKASLAQIEDGVKTCGLYRNKAKAIYACSRILERDYAGAVPEDMDELIALPGVGRKIANLIRSEWYHLPGMVVDTHCGRISRLLGLTKAEDPKKIEIELCRKVRKEHWSHWGHLMVTHGREICKANRPLCGECTLLAICPHGKKSEHGKR